ncbi:MAG TPA: cyclic nucleotide-binding domain-containing protein [Coleofasciculaceae cyanobacterium]|jgi:CRP-like cAMP-binding protein
MDKVFQHFNKGEVIIPEGSPGDRSFKIISGNVLICKKNNQGKMIPIARLGPSEIFGEMYLFEQSGVRSATAIAANDVKVEVFFKDQIQDEISQAAPEVRQMLSAFHHRLRNTTGNFASLFKEKVIVELPDGTMRVIDNKHG